MVIPSVASRMKQVLDTARQGIDPTEVRPLVKVATMACEREIIHVVRAVGHHMLDARSRTKRRAPASIISERSDQDAGEP